MTPRDKRQLRNADFELRYPRLAEATTIIALGATAAIRGVWKGFFIAVGVLAAIRLIGVGL